MRSLRPSVVLRYAVVGLFFLFACVCFSLVFLSFLRCSGGLPRSGVVGFLSGGLPRSGVVGFFFGLFDAVVISVIVCCSSRLALRVFVRMLSRSLLSARWLVLRLVRILVWT